jgi:hypothetical protein
LRYADGSNPLRRAQSSIEWRDEGFGVKIRSFWPGVAVPGEPALCPDCSAASGGAGDGRFDDEASRGVQGENYSNEGESNRRDGKDGHGGDKAQEAR